MAAIGSKRKRFVGEGNDVMQVTSLVKSLVSLPLSKSGARVHPSPGSITSSRLAVQTDLTGERCVAFVASGGGVYRHEVSFAGGTHVVEGKEVGRLSAWGSFVWEERRAEQSERRGMGGEHSCASPTWTVARHTLS